MHLYTDEELNSKIWRSMSQFGAHWDMSRLINRSIEEDEEISMGCWCCRDAELKAKSADKKANATQIRKPSSLPQFQSTYHLQPSNGILQMDSGGQNISRHSHNNYRSMNNRSHNNNRLSISSLKSNSRRSTIDTQEMFEMEGIYTTSPLTNRFCIQRNDRVMISVPEDMQIHGIIPAELCGKVGEVISPPEYGCNNDSLEVEIQLLCSGEVVSVPLFCLYSVC